MQGKPVRCANTKLTLYPPGVLHESYAHDSLKSSLAFRKPATAVASRRPARADGRSWSASMGMQASAPAELCGALGRAGYHCASGPMAKFVVDAGCSLQMGAA